MSIGIYKFQNLITQEVYIGQSINLEERYNKHSRNWLNGTTDFYKAIQDYGWNNFSYEILEICSQEQLNEKEQFWISYYDSYNNGYNMTKGGSNKNSINQEIVIEKWNSNLSPKEISKELKIGLSTVYQILNGYDEFQPQSKNKIVFQYDLAGNFIQSWNSYKEAGISLNISPESIGKVVSGKRLSAGGFQWKKEFQEKISSVENNTSIPKIIYQYDLNKNFIQKFDSLADACKAVSGDSSAIRRAAKKGLSRSAYGFRWSFDNI